MKKILTVLCLIGLGNQVGWCQQKVITTQPSNGRYQIYMGYESSPTILLDTKTGITWRNVKCGEEYNSDGTVKPFSGVVNCWQKMNYLDLTPKP